MTYVDPSGRTWRAEHTHRPFYVRSNNRDGSRHFGSLAAARSYSRGLVGPWQLFYDYRPGCGRLVERSD